MYWRNQKYWSCPAGLNTIARNRTLDYGANRMTVKDGITTFKLDHPDDTPFKGTHAGGTRVVYNWKSLSAYFCADIKVMSGIYPGAIFALYMISGQIESRVDKWNELDFEFVLFAPNMIWLNTWHEGLPLPGEDGFREIKDPINSGFHRYCIDWNLKAGIAKWIIDGVEFRSTKLTNWTKPLQPMMSFWGESSAWAGYTTWPRPLPSVQVKNIAYQIRM